MTLNGNSVLTCKQCVEFGEELMHVQSQFADLATEDKQLRAERDRYKAVLKEVVLEHSRGHVADFDCRMCTLLSDVTREVLK